MRERSLSFSVELQRRLKIVFTVYLLGTMDERNIVEKPVSSFVMSLETAHDGVLPSLGGRQVE